MIGMEVDHCQVISKSLRTSAPVDDQVLASIAVLNERLERVKSLGGMFAGISFSSDVEALNHWTSTSMAASSRVMS